MFMFLLFPYIVSCVLVLMCVLGSTGHIVIFSRSHDQKGRELRMGQSPTLQAIAQMHWGFCFTAALCYIWPFFVTCFSVALFFTSSRVTVFSSLDSYSADKETDGESHFPLCVTSFQCSIRMGEKRLGKFAEHGFLKCFPLLFQK